MPKEKSAGAIVFRVEKGEHAYLLLHYPNRGAAAEDYWDLPKGHMEQGETEKETVLREVREETGLRDVRLLGGFREEIHYWFEWEGKKVFKTVAFYLAQTTAKEVTISEEHIDFVWLPFGKAVEKLTYENAKLVLKKAHDFISRTSV